MSKKTPIVLPVSEKSRPSHVVPEKPFAARMKRQLTGQPLEDVILDPDNPNLIMEKKRDL